MDQNSFQKFLRSPVFFRTLTTILGLVVAGIVFQVGFIVGFHEASFEVRWQANYGRNFAGPLGNPADLDDRLPNPHGAFGTVTSVEFPTFTIVGPRETEKVIRMGSSTILRSGFDTVSTDAVRVGEEAVVIGTPNNQGEIDATFIRLAPATTTTVQ
jgi:hypothetical protein